MLNAVLVSFYASKSIEYFSPGTCAGLLHLSLLTNCATSPVEKTIQWKIPGVQEVGGVLCHLLWQRN